MQPGSIVAGRYEIVARIGGGGMGEVYRAVHSMSRRAVALKLIGAGAGHDAAAAVRFQREASASAEIGHPGIVEVYDAGVDPGSGAFFLAMELLEGHSLSQRTGRAALPWILALLEPLAAAHAKGFVHRDLKPANVMVARVAGREQIKLLDFGIARRLSDLGATGTGEMMGTPYYMAPEQAMSARDAGPAADVFSVGVMLYEALAGRRPFEAASMAELAIEMQTREPPPLDLFAPDAPPGLAALVGRCLSRDPAARPADASALRAELEPLLSRLPAAAPSAVTPVRHEPAAYAATMAPGTQPAATAATAPAAASAVPYAAIAPAAPSAAPYAATAPAGAVSAIPPTAAPAASAPAPRRSGARGCLVAGVIAVLVIGVAATAGVLAWTGAFEDDGLHEVEGEGFSMRVPIDWRPSAFARTDYLLQYAEAAPGAVPRQICVGSYQSAYTADQALDYSLQGIVENGGRVEQRRSATIDGHPAREARFFLPHPTGHYRQINRTAVVSGHAWVLTCVGPADTFAEQEIDCHAMFDSFELR